MLKRLTQRPLVIMPSQIAIQTMEPGALEDILLAIKAPLMPYWLEPSE